MKNQYVGDINDYLKYGLLRILTGTDSLSLTVCWMLTEQDASTDGAITNYLDNPSDWREHDPELFDYLKSYYSGTQIRQVDAITRFEPLSHAIFFDENLTDDRVAREAYFQRLFERSKGVDLVFFDPDNGMEIKSRPNGSKDSCKYLYWSEVKQAFDNGHSVLVFQYFPRAEHTKFIEQTARRAASETGQTEILWYSSSRVLYLLIPQSRHLKHFRAKEPEISQRWNPRIATGFAAAEP